MPEHEGFMSVVSWDKKVEPVGINHYRTNPSIILKSVTCRKLENISVVAQYDPQTTSDLFKDLIENPPVQDIEIWQDFFMFSRCRMRILVKRFKGSIYLHSMKSANAQEDECPTMSVKIEVTDNEPISER